jgi:capsular exopolysaccharide synthesis family protein
MIGILIPVGIITARELLRDKVANRADVEKRTSAPILAEIGHSDDDHTLVVTRNSRRFIAEQFRILRSNLKYMTTKKENPIIMVTSSFSSEGKSFISTNVAAVLALSGKKTVLMEFDIRKPKVLEGLGMKRKMGITNYIIGRAKIDDIIMQVPGFDNFFVIACGPIPPNPAELLLDSKLEDLMREIRERFEVVVMDTAPVGLVSDSVTLGRFADCTLYVIRQGHTYRKILRLVDDLYIEKKLPGISLVMNDVKLEGGYYSGYYGGYGYYGG